jgi:hypothetical protein
MKPHNDLREFHRLRMELRDEENEKQKALILYVTLKEKPYLVEYLKMGKDPRRQFGITSAEAFRSAPANMDNWIRRGICEILYLFGTGRCARAMMAPMWVGYIIRLPEELRETANCILDKNLRCGLTWRAINWALRKAGHPEIPVE